MAIRHTVYVAIFLNIKIFRYGVFIAVFSNLTCQAFFTNLTKLTFKNTKSSMDFITIKLYNPFLNACSVYREIIFYLNYLHLCALRSKICLTIININDYMLS